jgi:Immunity protein 26
MNAVSKTKKIKYLLGSIVAIPIKENKYAFAKTFKDGDLGVYDLISNAILPLEDVLKHPISFYQYATDTAIKNGEWPILGVEPFASEEEAWLPPMATWYIKETDKWTTGKTRIYFKDEGYFVPLKEVRGLDIFSVCDRPESMVHVIEDRLIKGNHDNYKVKG